jgi:ATP-dependent Clp protease ATP-binding subunit ClpA
VLVARRPRLERHHAVAITDDALKAAIVLTDRFVPERARPDKAIDVLDEACAHAQATVRVGPELERLIRERRKVDAMIRRGLVRESADEPLGELGAMLDRIGDEIQKLLGGESPGKTEKDDAGPSPSLPVPPRPSLSLSERRNELDRLLRAELESHGVVVTGIDVARVVSTAVGKGIEWAG